MDFIERWLGVSPDGGNGMFELFLLLVPLVLVVALWTVRRRADRPSRRGVRRR
jgi:hypothetical protein